MRKTLVALLVAGLAVGASACSDSSSSGGGGSSGLTRWAGLAQGGDGVESGSVAIAVLSSSPSVVGAGNGIMLAPGDISAAAVYSRGAPTQATLNLSGTYNPSNKTLSVSGSGYTFTGTYDGQSQLDGNFSGPTTNGTFVTLQGAELAEAFCGTYSGGDNGSWSFIIKGTEVRGQAQSSSEGAPITLEGVVGRKDSLTFYVPGTQDVMGTGTVTTQGVITPFAEGDWSEPGTQVSGTWEADQCFVETAG